MPSMAHITVKNAANVDVIYSAATPSAGDKSAAVWRANAASTILGNRPQMSLATRDNGNKNGRVYEASFRGVVKATVAGVETQLAIVPFTFTGTLPTNVDGTQVEDMFVQCVNLLASALFRSSASEGYAPN